MGGNSPPSTEEEESQKYFLYIRGISAAPWQEGKENVVGVHFSKVHCVGKHVSFSFSGREHGEQPESPCDGVHVCAHVCELAAVGALYSLRYNLSPGYPCLQLTQADVCPLSLPEAIGGRGRPEASDSKPEIFLSQILWVILSHLHCLYPVIHPSLDSICRMLLGARSFSPSSLIQP